MVRTAGGTRCFLEKGEIEECYDAAEVAGWGELEARMRRIEEIEN